MSRSARSTGLGLVASALLVLLPLRPAGAAEDPHRGDTATVTHDGTLAIDKQTGAFDPSPSTGASVRQGLAIPIGRDPKKLSSDIGTGFLSTATKSLFDVSIPGSVLDVLDLLDYNPTKLYVGPAGTLTPWFQVAHVSKGEVSASWPVSVAVEVPAANSFACGDTVEVKTTLTAGNAASLWVDPPYHEIELGMSSSNVHVEASLDFCTPGTCLVPPLVPHDYCAPGCWVSGWCLSDETDDISFRSPGDSRVQPLITICHGAFKSGASWGDVAGCSGTDQVLAWRGIVLDQQTASDKVNFKLSVPKLPEITGVFLHPRPEDLSLQRAADNRVLTLTGNKQGTVTIGLDLISLLDYLCVACPIGVNPTRLGIPGLGGVDLGDLMADYGANHLMSYAMTPSFTDRLQLGLAMEGQELAADGTPLGSKESIDARTIPADHGLRLVFPSDRSTAVEVDSSYGVSGALATRTQQQYFVGSRLALIQMDFKPYVNDWSLFEEPPVRWPTGNASTVEDATTTWSGAGFPGARFYLDPENPVLQISGFAVRDSMNLGGGERAVVYRVSLHNAGDVALLDVHAQLDLAAAFTAAGAHEVEAVCLDAPGLVANGAYDGIGDTELLAPGNRLEVDETRFVDVLVRVEPAAAEIVGDGCFAPVEYAGHGHADATSPIGTAVKNNWNQCTRQATGQDLVARVDLGAAIPTAVTDFAVYGYRSLDLSRGMQRSLGNAGTGGMLQVLPLRGAAVGDPRIVGDLHVGGDVHVVQGPLTVDYAQVGGRVVAADPVAQLVTTGALSAWSGCVRTFSAPAWSPAPQVPGAPDVVVAAGRTKTLGPGAYGRVEVARGGTLVLSGGAYDVARLRITGDGATVLFGATGGLLLLRDWQMENVRGLRLGASGASATVQVVYAGNAKQVLRGAVLAGAFEAPAAAVELREASALHGSLHAERVLVDEGSFWVGSRYEQPLQIGGTCTDALQVQ